jgi:hypothetical protein
MTSSQTKRQRYHDKLAQDYARTLNSLLTDVNRRAVLKGITATITLEDLVTLWHRQQGRCAMSGLAMSLAKGTLKHRNYYKVSVDRIVCDGGYTQDNIQLVCYLYNTAKGTCTDAEVLDFSVM